MFQLLTMTGWMRPLESQPVRPSQWGHQRTTKRRLKKSTAGTFQNQIIPDCFYFDILFLFWYMTYRQYWWASRRNCRWTSQIIVKFCPEIKLDGRSMRTCMIDVYTGWLRTLSVVQWIPSCSDSHFCRNSVNVTEKFKNHETLYSGDSFNKVEFLFW